MLKTRSVAAMLRCRTGDLVACHAGGGSMFLRRARSRRGPRTVSTIPRHFRIISSTRFSRIARPSSIGHSRAVDSIDCPSGLKCLIGIRIKTPARRRGHRFQQRLIRSIFSQLFLRTVQARLPGRSGYPSTAARGTTPAIRRSERAPGNRASKCAPAASGFLKSPGPIA